VDNHCQAGKFGLAAKESQLCRLQEGNERRSEILGQILDAVQSQHGAQLDFLGAQRLAQFAPDHIVHARGNFEHNAVQIKKSHGAQTPWSKAGISPEGR